MKKLVALFFMFVGMSLSASVQVVNDSPFPLKATIVSATGVTIGEVTVYPRSTIRWMDNYQNFSYNYTASQTPYSVIFQCMDGGEYGVATEVGAGATVTAQSAAGRRYCKPQKQQSYGPPNTDS